MVGDAVRRVGLAARWLARLRVGIGFRQLSRVERRDWRRGRQRARVGAGWAHWLAPWTTAAVGAAEPAVVVVLHPVHVADVAREAAVDRQVVRRGEAEVGLADEVRLEAGEGELLREQRHVERRPVAAYVRLEAADVHREATRDERPARRRAVGVWRGRLVSQKRHPAGCLGPTHRRNGARAGCPPSPTGRASASARWGCAAASRTSPCRLRRRAHSQRA